MAVGSPNAKILLDTFHMNIEEDFIGDATLGEMPLNADNIEMMLHFKRVERPAAGVYGGLCVAPYHFKHFDELLADIGVSGRRANPLVEKFTPPDAAAYGRFLALAPAYRAA